jgi:hypothetical protein
MNELTDVFNMMVNGDLVTAVGGLGTVLLVILLAFVVGQIIAWTYMWTHTSLSYSRMYVASLVVLPVLVALVMLLMQGNIVFAFGLLAVFAVVRFRNVLKDTRDTVFVLWAIVMGLAVGTMRFSTALVGCLCVAAIFLYLRVTSFGSRHRYDVILNLHWIGPGRAAAQLRPVLQRHSARTFLASERAAPDEGMDICYRLLLRDPGRSRELLEELEATDGVEYATVSQREEDESEI